MAIPYRSAMTFALSLALSAGLIAMLVHSAGVEQFLSTVSGISLPWVILALFTFAGSWFFRTWRLARFTTSFTSRAWYLFKIQIGGFALNSILPVKIGDAIIIFGLRSLHMGIGYATAIAVQLRILDLLVITAATLPLFFLKLNPETSSRVSTSLYVLGCISATPFLMTWLVRNGILLRIIDHAIKFTNNLHIRFILDKIKSTLSSYELITRQKITFMTTLAISCAIWYFEFITTFIISNSLNLDIKFVYIIPAVALANMSKAAPTTPGGLGVYESVMALILQLSGTSTQSAITLAICDHVFKKICTIGVGFPILAKILGDNWIQKIKDIKLKGMSRERK